jgi:phage replication O-like protein O
MSVQLENGYTRIANELLEKMMVTSIPARHKDLWWFVVRKTYGFHKKQDVISLSQFQKGLRIDRSSVCRIIKDLVAWNLLGKIQGKYWIIKDYTKWVVAYRPLGGSGVGVNGVVAHSPHTKEMITKETNTKDIVLHTTTKVVNKDVDKIISKFKEEFDLQVLDESDKVNRRYAWLMLVKCKKDLPMVLRVIELAAGDDFYSDKISSIKSLYYKMVGIVQRARGKTREVKNKVAPAYANNKNN